MVSVVSVGTTELVVLVPWGESCFGNVLIERTAKAVQSYASDSEIFLGVEEVFHSYTDDWWFDFFCLWVFFFN